MMRPVNLLPEIKYKKPLDPLTRRLRMITVILVGLLVVLYGAGFGYKYLRESKLSDIEAEIERLQPVADRHAQMMSLNGEVNSLKGHLTKYKATPVGDALRLVAELMPSDISITSFTYNAKDKAITINTQGGTLNSIGQFHHNLLQSPDFAEPKLGALSHMGNGRYRVTISVRRRE